MVDHLTALDEQGRTQFLGDMALLGEALHACTETIRVNYEILTNSETALHAHVIPHYSGEPKEYRSGPVWNYPAELRTSVAFSESTHGELRQTLGTYLSQRLDL